MTFDNAQYLIVLSGCLLLTVPLEFVLGARVYRRPRRVGLTLLLAVPCFLLWDLIATSRGVWSFSEEYVIGWYVLGLPIEEWLFFVVIPICALLTYEAVSAMARAIRKRERSRVECPAARDVHHAP